MAHPLTSTFLRMDEITKRPALWPRRWWVRLRNRFVPWFMWSY